MSDPRDRFNLWACPRCGYQSIEGITGGVGPWPGDGQVRCPSSTCEYRTVMEYEGTLTRHLMDISQGGLGDEDALRRARELEQARAEGYDAGLAAWAATLEPCPGCGHVDAIDNIEGSPLCAACSLDGRENAGDDD